MKITKSFQEKMLDMGVLHLKNASKKMQDNENFVMKAIEKHGIGEFQFASERLRSEGRILLRLADKYPEVVKYATFPVYQRYIGTMGEEVAEVMKYISVFLMDMNEETFKHMPLQMAVQFYDFACSNAGCYISFYGGEKKAIPMYGKKYIKMLEEARPDVVKASYDARMEGYAQARMAMLKKRAKLANEASKQTTPLNKESFKEVSEKE